jgi:hypothetical protein
MICDNAASVTIGGRYGIPYPVNTAYLTAGKENL